MADADGDAWSQRPGSLRQRAAHDWPWRTGGSGTGSRSHSEGQADESDKESETSEPPPPPPIQPADTRQCLLIVEVAHKSGVDRMRVFDGDKASEIAASFASLHSLGPSQSDALTRLLEATAAARGFVTDADGCFTATPLQVAQSAPGSGLQEAAAEPVPTASSRTKAEDVAGREERMRAGHVDGRSSGLYERGSSSAGRAQSEGGKSPSSKSSEGFSRDALSLTGIQRGVVAEIVGSIEQRLSTSPPLSEAAERIAAGASYSREVYAKYRDSEAIGRAGDEEEAADNAYYTSGVPRREQQHTADGAVLGTLSGGASAAPNDLAGAASSEDWAEGSASEYYGSPWPGSQDSLLRRHAASSDCSRSLGGRGGSVRGASERESSPPRYCGRSRGDVQQQQQPGPALFRRRRSASFGDVRRQRQSVDRLYSAAEAMRKRREAAVARREEQERRLAEDMRSRPLDICKVSRRLAQRRRTAAEHASTSSVYDSAGGGGSLWAGERLYQAGMAQALHTQRRREREVEESASREAWDAWTCPRCGAANGASETFCRAVVGVSGTAALRRPQAWVHMSPERLAVSVNGDGPAADALLRRCSQPRPPLFQPQRVAADVQTRRRSADGEPVWEQLYRARGPPRGAGAQATALDVAEEETFHPKLPRRSHSLARKREMARQTDKDSTLSDGGGAMATVARRRRSYRDIAILGNDRSSPKRKSTGHLDECETASEPGVVKSHGGRARSCSGGTGLFLELHRDGARQRKYQAVRAREVTRSQCPFKPVLAAAAPRPGDPAATHSSAEGGAPAREAAAEAEPASARVELGAKDDAFWTRLHAEHRRRLLRREALRKRHEEEAEERRRREDLVAWMSPRRRRRLSAGAAVAASGAASADEDGGIAGSLPHADPFMPRINRWPLPNATSGRTTAVAEQPLPPPPAAFGGNSALSSSQGQRALPPPAPSSVHEKLFKDGEKTRQRQRQEWDRGGANIARKASGAHVGQRSQALLRSMRQRHFTQAFRTLLASAEYTKLTVAHDDGAVEAAAETVGRIFDDMAGEWTKMELDVSRADVLLLKGDAVPLARAALDRWIEASATLANAETDEGSSQASSDAASAAPKDAAGAGASPPTLPLPAFLELMENEFRKRAGEAGPSSGPLLAPRKFADACAAASQARKDEAATAEAAELTFVPRIDARSRELAKGRGRDGRRPIEDVLGAELRATEGRKKELQSKVRANELSECTHRPKLNAKRVKAAAAGAAAAAAAAVAAAAAAVAAAAAAVAAAAVEGSGENTPAAMVTNLAAVDAKGSAVSCEPETDAFRLPLVEVEGDTSSSSGGTSSTAEAGPAAGGTRAQRERSGTSLGEGMKLKSADSWAQWMEQGSDGGASAPPATAEVLLEL